VNKFLRTAPMTIALVLLATPVFAQGGTSVEFSGAFGAGLVVIGAAYGIGKLAAATVESMARQPSIAGTAQLSMIIAAALIEGFTFFALVVCQGQMPAGWGQ
jgi:F-type H+-transporting ATPase subunit c